jgi:hypothetical protein
MEETRIKSLAGNGPFRLSTKPVDKFVEKLGESAPNLRRIRLFVTLP